MLWQDLAALTIACCRQSSRSSACGYLRLKVVVKRITVNEFQVNDGGGKRLFWNRGKGGHSEVDEYDNSKIYREMRSGLKRPR